ncbi:DUF3419 family protein [Alkalilimnicola ehrlichii]|uniref:DUF3419 family protein n=1 Tax=Alkalilimnicola ehrlichii TaxID=351052 RepID=UPI00286895BB|nr:DUF3419 family protein [Alkalilimnicola ehrlichii]
MPGTARRRLPRTGTPRAAGAHGLAPWRDRAALYRRCRTALTTDTRRFWDTQGAAIRQGIGSAGKFERYFRLFRQRVLPLVHSSDRVAVLLAGGDRHTRQQFYDKQWDSWRWRLLFRLFFSRFVMGRLGRDPAFFRYVEGSVADRLLARTRHALTALDPAENPYLHWILTGEHGSALPYALRQENFDAIRTNLDRLEWHRCSVEEYLPRLEPGTLHACNLSDIFEYMSSDAQEQLLTRLHEAGCPGGRLAYWNMLAPRCRPESLADRLHPLTELADRLHTQDKAFFYSRFVVEELR